MGTLQRIFFAIFLITTSLALDHRLPDTIVPIFYDLCLNIDPSLDNYNGTVNITLRTSTDTDEIYIHEDEDSIIIGSVILNDDIKCSPGNPNEAGILVITCAEATRTDEDNFLYIEFTGKFSEQDGYGLVKTEQNPLVIESNFKPTFARRAFPCLDEPELKANFSVTVTHPSNYTVISNTPVVTRTNEKTNVTTTKFADTPAISTYLVSIFLSQFKEVKTQDVENVDYKMYARAEVKNDNNIADTYYPEVIKKLDEFTGVPYENLSDVASYLIAVPDYSDAMGDFGVFAYRETDLLDEGDKTTYRAKQNIIKAMAYKVSHEWYGGDVAIKWWSDIWANEAIATYLQYVIADEVEDSLELMNQFLLEVTQNMLQDDGYSFAQALTSKESDVNVDWEIETKLNSLNFAKGSTILNMITAMLGGKENFQSALQAHWQKRRESDTDAADLIKDLLEGKNDRDVDFSTILEKWIFSPGYPLITVKLKEVNETDIATVTQKRFVYPTNETIEEDDSDWYIPLTSVNRANNRPYTIDVFLQPDDDMMYFFAHGSWLVFNSQGISFYRVNYDEELWGRIRDGIQANRSEFHVLQRAQIVDDIFNIARIGDDSYSLAFQIADLLANETDYYPWYSAFNVFSYLLETVEDKGVVWNLKNYILTLMANIIVIPKDNFIEEGDSHIDVLKKVMVLNWACKLGHERCITYVTQKFEAYKKSQTSLEDFNPREIIFCNGIRHSQNVQEDWDFLWNVYIQLTSVHEEADILKALGCAEDKKILSLYLQKIVTINSNIKKQDIVVVLKSVLSSSVGLETAMDFLQSNLSDIQSSNQDMRILSEMIYIVAGKLASDEQLAWLKNLLNDTVFEDYEDVKTKAVTLASVNNYWRNHFQHGVEEIFPSPTTQSTSTTHSGHSGSVAIVAQYTLPLILVVLAMLNK